MKKLMINARTTEVDTVSDRLISAFNKNNWNNDTYLIGIFNELKSLSDKLTAAIKRIKIKSILEEMDGKRDEKIKAINYLVMGLIHLPNTDIQNSAKKVVSIFEHYGVSITRKSYTEQTSLVESLLNDLANPELQSSIDLLSGLNQLISELRTAQTDFEEAKVNYEAEKAGLKTKENATRIKKEVLAIINGKLIVYLQAMVQVDEVKYGELGQVVSQVIEDINSLVKKRRKSNLAADE